MELWRLIEIEIGYISVCVCAHCFHAGPTSTTMILEIRLITYTIFYSPSRPGSKQYYCGGVTASAIDYALLENVKSESLGREKRKRVEQNAGFDAQVLASIVPISMMVIEVYV